MKPRTLLVLALGWVPVAAADDAPAWLQAAASSPVPAYDRIVPAVVLLDEGEATVEPGGKLRRVARWAVKVLTAKGIPAAAVNVQYGTDARKVISLDAWLIPSSGKVKKYGKGEAVDVAVSPEDVYNESRARVLSAEHEASVGDVFGYEAVVEERPLFAQDIWPFQTSFPVRISRYALSLPPGWRAEGKVFNHPGLTPTVTGSRYVWELRELPFIAGDEVLSPPLTRAAPRLAVSFFPADGADASMSTFAAWSDVSRWYSALSDPQSQAVESVAVKARELTRGARTEIEKVRAIARYVQSTNYISVQIGVGRYRPHDAAEVLAKSYGDCKDKANLMRALLKAVGIPSYLVLVYSGDAFFVREEWASPSQFNHCILAVKLTGPETLAAVVDGGALGLLLFFDPTRPHTVLGDLPADEQGSWALVAASADGRLLRLPKLAPQAHAFERTVEATLTPDGTLTAVVREISAGQAAAEERALFDAPRADVARRLDAWVARGTAAAKITRFHHQDDSDTGRFTLDLELTATRYAQSLQQRLLLFRPVILGRREWVFSADGPRTQAVELHDEAFSESVQIALPEGFAVDELPPPVTVEAGFGAYTSRAESAGAHLRFKRRFELRRTTIPVEEHAAVRQFFEKVRAAEGAQVVLARTR